MRVEGRYVDSAQHLLQLVNIGRGLFLDDTVAAELRGPSIPVFGWGHTGALSLRSLMEVHVPPGWVAHSADVVRSQSLGHFSGVCRVGRRGRAVGRPQRQ